MHLLVAPDGALHTIRPYAFADAWHEDRAETADAFIHAARVGLLEPTWDVVCPKCMIAHESHAELAHVRQHGACTACATAFERDLQDSVELVFAPHPSIRALERQTFCAGSPGKRPHILLQQVLEPGEERTVTFDLPRGSYRVVGALAKQGSELISSAVGFETHGDVEKTVDRIVAQPAVLFAGEVRLTFRNAGTVEEPFRLEIAAARNDAVTAAAALTHPSFRSFFADQLLAPGEHVRVSHMAFVFVELLSKEALFDAIGDGPACAELSRPDALVHGEASTHEGDLVPSAMTKLVLAFPTSARAFRAALAIRKRITAARRRSPRRSRSPSTVASASRSRGRASPSSSARPSTGANRSSSTARGTGSRSPRRSRRTARSRCSRTSPGTRSRSIGRRMVRTPAAG